MSRRSVALALAALTAAAVALDLGGVHRFHTADSLVPVLVSLHRWTPYYWEQNRYGMLTPLLASPAGDPLANLLVQTGLTAWAGLACFPLAATFLGCRAPAAVGLLAAAAFVTFAPTALQVLFFTTYNVFAVSLALGLAALNVAAGGWRSRLPLAVGLVAVGAWVNGALGLFLAPVALAVGGRRAGPGVALAAFGVAAALALQSLAPYPTTAVSVPPPREWGYWVTVMFDWGLSECGPTYWGLALVTATAIAAAQLAHPRWRAEAAAGLRKLAAVAAGGLAYSAAMAVLFEGRWRYAAPALVLAHAAAFAAALRPWAARLPRRNEPVAVALAGLLLVGATVARWGVPSLGGVAADTRVTLGRGVPEIVAAGCTHVVADYWLAWPAMFAANRAYRDAGVPTTLWAISYRSDPIRAQSEAVPRERVRVACFADDGEAAYFRAEFHLPLVLLERRGPIEIWVPAGGSP